MRDRSLIILLLLAPMLSFATGPKFNSITPPGGQRGTELDLKLNGSRLQDAQELIFYSPGFKVLDLDGAKTNSVKARIRISDQCRLGEHFLRIRTASGLSELRSFFVGAYTNLTEAEPNNERQKAQKIPLNVTINGSTGQEDIDYYEVAVQKGQRLAVEVEAMRLGRTMVDPYVAIRDSQGKVLAASDDTALLLQDCAAAVVTPEDGSYYIEVRESTYSGTADSAYRLHVGEFPRPSAVYPPGGRAGERLQIRFVGDDQKEITQEIQLPDSPEDKFGVFAEANGQSAPSPNWLRVSPFPNVLEGESNHSREEATTASTELPLALNGIVSTNREVDWFRFTAKKGKSIDVSLYARRIRSPLDSVIEICDAKGKVLAQNDDSSGPDSSLKFSPPEDGDYFISVTDQLGKGGPDYTYRVELVPTAPALALTIPQVARNDSQTRQYITVPKGNRYAALISAKRSNFSGPLKLGLDGLPKGVAMFAETMSGKQDAMPVVFEAAPDAVVDGKLLDLIGESTNGVRGHFKQEVEFIYGQNNQVYYGGKVDRIAFAVTEAVPFSLKIVEPRVPLVQSGTMDLKIVADRAEGFMEPITVKMLWNPPGIGSQPEVTIPRGSNSVIYPLNANGSADPQSWKIAVIGSATVNGGAVYVSSQLAPLEISTPYLAGKIDTLTLRPGEKGKLICKLDQKTPFDGKATIKLMGLPDKVTTSPREITRDDKEVAFDIAVDPACQPRSTRSLFCNAIIYRDGEPVPHSLANGGALRIVPPKKEGGREGRLAAKADGAK